MANKVLLIDDQVLFVESLRNVIQNRASDFQVVGVYYNADAAIEAISRLHPDLILMDVRMPGTDGVQATRRIIGQWPDTKVLMLTTYDEDEYVKEAVNVGAIGYLLKDMPPDALIACMRSALSGQFQIPSKHVTRVITSSGDQAISNKGNPPEWLFELSRKERLILRLVGEGLENDEIASRVFLAPQTVKNYISRLYSKADVASRAHLIRLGRDLSQYL